MGRTVHVPETVRRIVSLVPSQTELLIDLGLENVLAGITKFCVHPEGLKRRIPLVGGTKTVHEEAVRRLAPDLIIGNKEENLQSDIENLEKSFPVWMSDIHNLDEALEMIVRIGALTGTEEKAQEIRSAVLSEFTSLPPIPPHRPSVLYLIWRKPYMAAGTGTFIDDMLRRCGLQNCIQESRYPEFDQKTVHPEMILLSSEPYPFKEKHTEELQEMYPDAKIYLVDGEFFSWYGSRLLKAPAYFRELIEQLHADRQTEGFV